MISERSTDHEQTKADSKSSTDEKTLCDKVLVEGVSRDSNGTGSTWRDNVADYPEQVGLSKVGHNRCTSMSLGYVGPDMVFRPDTG